MPEVTVVGIGADAWDAVRTPDVVLGSRRQLDLVPAAPPVPPR